MIRINLTGRLDLSGRVPRLRALSDNRALALKALPAFALPHGATVRVSGSVEFNKRNVPSLIVETINL